MEITRLEKNGFKIKGRKAIILADPHDKLKSLTVQVIISSSNQVLPKVKGEPVIIFGPGEYEIRGVRIWGFQEKKEVFFKIEIDNLFLLYLNHLSEKISEEKIEALGDVDILFLPIKKPKLATLYISQLDPFVVIPIENQGVDQFLKEEGINQIEKVGKYVVSKGDLPEERKVVVLK